MQKYTELYFNSCSKRSRSAEGMSRTTAMRFAGLHELDSRHLMSPLCILRRTKNVCDIKAVAALPDRWWAHMAPLKELALAYESDIVITFKYTTIAAHFLPIYILTKVCKILMKTTWFNDITPSQAMIDAISSTSGIYAEFDWTIPSFTKTSISNTRLTYTELECDFIPVALIKSR